MFVLRVLLRFVVETQKGPDVGLDSNVGEEKRNNKECYRLKFWGRVDAKWDDYSLLR
jgi:hypothetical protein